ncbi:hypothetical protein MB02_07555 [Croceicoccus estronivorus]|nr:hypothetical protein MB02_07555 [Croceicoccus estronivorus]
MTRLLMGVSLTAIAQPVLAQDSAQQKDAPTEHDAASTDTSEAANADMIVVTADRVGLLERQPSDTIFGLGMSLLETPRAASVASDTTLERYGIKTVTDLVAVAPGGGTASWFGIPGSINLRGTMSDNYYRGFQRLPNFATYSTPLGGASSVEIVRGPPSPIYGPGRVGGFLNYTPKSARNERGYIDGLTGEVTVTGGSYSKKNATLLLGAPVNLGEVQGGISGYVEVDDSHSYFRGMNPRYQLYQLDGSFDLGGGFTLSGSGLIYHSKGFIQVFVNRLTQELVDDGIYNTGRDTSLIDLDGNGRLTPNESTPSSFHNNWNGVDPAPISDRGTLDEGVGTAKLDHRTTSISDRDFNNTTTQTYFADMSKELGDGKLSLSYFADKIKNDRYFSYGFPASYRATAQEIRLTFRQPFDFSENLKVDTVFGASYRTIGAVKKESYLGGFVSVDRRDIIFGATPTDTFDDPFSEEPGNIGQSFETQVYSRTKDAGLFGMLNITALKRLNILLGGRYDKFKVRSRDEGTIVYSPAVRGETFSDKKGDWTYSASITYHAPFGLMPYITHAQATAFESNQAGDIQPGQIANQNWLSASKLTEAGVKFEMLQGKLIGSVAYYDQRRRRNDPLTDTSIQTHSKGWEGEFRLVANKHFSFTGAGNIQKTWTIGDTSNTYLPPEYAGVPNADGYGQNYRTKYSTLYPDLIYRYTLIPKTIVSFFGSYTSDTYDWGEVGGTAGVIHTGKTQTLLPVDPVKFPSYTVINASIYYKKEGFTISGNVTNLFDKKYYQPGSESTANVVTVPGSGREWRITLGYKF